MRSLLSLITLLLAFAAACGEEGGAGAGGGEEPRRFVAHLGPLNRADVEGTARMSLRGDRLTVDLDAVGVEPEIHRLHIQALRDGGEATCPAREDDTNRNRFVGLEEGQSAYGSDKIKLEPFPTANSSRKLSWDLTLPVDPEDPAPLDRRVFLILGRSANLDGKRGAEYVPDMPVACGRIESLAGTASEGSQG